MPSFAEQKLWFQEFSSITVVTWLLTCSVRRDLWTWPYPIRLNKNWKISIFASVKYSRSKLDSLVKFGKNSVHKNSISTKILSDESLSDFQHVLNFESLKVSLEAKEATRKAEKQEIKKPPNHFTSTWISQSH